MAVDWFEILGVVRRINGTIRQRLTAQVAGHGLEFTDVMVLTELWERGPQRLTQLGQALRLSPSTVFGVVERLAARGLVQRGPDPDDRRATVISLRDKQSLLARGSELVKTAFPGLVQLDPAAARDIIAALNLLLRALGAETEQ